MARLQKKLDDVHITAHVTLNMTEERKHALPVDSVVLVALNEGESPFLTTAAVRN